MNTARKRARRNPPKRNENDAVATFQAPKDLIAKLKRRAKREDRSFASLLRTALAKLVENDEPVPPNDKHPSS